MVSSLIFSSLLLALAVSAQSDPFQKYTISAPGINVSCIPFGATLTNVYVKDKNGDAQDVVLGHDDGRDYLGDAQSPVKPNLGSTIGRYSNRIRNGTFTIDGVTSHVSTNEHSGLNTLHGGKVGYDQRNWTVVSHNDTSITFSLLDEGFEGFPGSVVTYATYTVEANRWISRIVSIALDAPTPIMVINHPYWNLGAFVDPNSSTILNDTLHLPLSSRFIVVDGIQVPTGEIGTVKGTGLDFTTPKQLGRDLANTAFCGTGCVGYDNDFIIDRPRYGKPGSFDDVVLSMSSKNTGIQMDVRTNQQSVVVFSCGILNGAGGSLKSSQQKGGVKLVPDYGCIAIEPQQWTDGINHPEWGQQQYQIYSPSTGPAVLYARYDFSIVGDSGGSKEESNATRIG
ncbi:MAG: hypothetical protein M1816_000254 [Peltula sp. TS41687]|nr:MAG: hypothetical protein M1816_000254 [Peltula sp. TS41687]